MGPRENKELVARLYREGFSGDLRGLNRFFAPNYKDHSFFGDLKSLKAALHTFKSAYPNLEWRAEQVIAEGDRVCVRATLLVKSATGVMKTLGSTSIYRVQQGKIVEHWGHGDPLF